MVCDAQRPKLTNFVLLCILYMVCIHNKYSNNINDERKEREAPSIISYIINTITIFILYTYHV